MLAVGHVNVSLKARVKLSDQWRYAVRLLRVVTHSTGVILAGHRKGGAMNHV